MPTDEPPSQPPRQDNLLSLTRRATLNIMLGSIADWLVGGETAAPPKIADSKVQFTKLDPAKPMPVLKLFHLNGKPVDLAPRPGKAMLVNLFATWCGICDTELRLLDALQKDMGKVMDFAAIAQDGGGKSIVEPFLHKLALKQLTVYLDPDGASTGIAREGREPGPFVLHTMPMYYIITTEGRIAGFVPGAVNWTSESARSLLSYFAQAQ
jgi:thiol-disulfide isomerase/thioredoxin